MTWPTADELDAIYKGYGSAANRTTQKAGSASILAPTTDPLLEEDMAMADETQTPAPGPIFDPAAHAKMTTEQAHALESQLAAAAHDLRVRAQDRIAVARARLQAAHDAHATALQELAGAKTSLAEIHAEEKAKVADLPDLDPDEVAGEPVKFPDPKPVEEALGRGRSRRNEPEEP